MSKLDDISRSLGCQECVRRNRITEPEAKQQIKELMLEVYRTSVEEAETDFELVKVFEKKVEEL